MASRLMWRLVVVESQVVSPKLGPNTSGLVHSLQQVERRKNIASIHTFLKLTPSKRRSIQMVKKTSSLYMSFFHVGYQRVSVCLQSNV